MVPVSIVILSYNRLDEIKKNLTLIVEESKTENEFELIIVDNNSNDGTREFLIKFCALHKSIILELTDVNLGVAVGKNIGFAKASREFIVALDNDTEISTKDLRRIPDLFSEHEDVGILAFKVLHPLTGELQNPFGNIGCEVANYHGAGCAFRRELLNSLGGISQERDYGGDELDFSIRVRNAGWGIRYTPEITILHNSLIRDSSNEKWRIERWTWNFLTIFFTYFPFRMAMLYSFRFFMPLFFYYIKHFGIRNLFTILDAALRGIQYGRKMHKPVSKATIIYYQNKNLRPDLGNVPLILKLLNKLRRRL